MGVAIKEKTVTKEILKEPKMYCCVIHNDEITTMDFVVMAIVKVFNLSTYEATEIMLKIHNNGSERLGYYCYDIAETKKLAMDSLSKAYNYPLVTTVEEAGNATG